MTKESMNVLEQALASLRIPAVVSEMELHAQVRDALEQAGFAVEHEVRLAPRCRIDFLAGEIGIELKKGKPDRTRLLQQIGRYLESSRLAGMLVVVERSVMLPSSVRGKPVRVVSLNRLWGVALP